MTTHRRTTALLAALTTLLGGPFAASAVADADADAESAQRGARPALTGAPAAPAATPRPAGDLASALGVAEDRLVATLHDLRVHARTTDVVGARPAIRTDEERAAEREAYVARLAARLDVPADRVRDALAWPDR